MIPVGLWWGCTPRSSPSRTTGETPPVRRVGQRHQVPRSAATLRCCWNLSVRDREYWASIVSSMAPATSQDFVTGCSRRTIEEKMPIKRTGLRPIDITRRTIAQLQFDGVVGAEWERMGCHVPVPRTGVRPCRHGDPLLAASICGEPPTGCSGRMPGSSIRDYHRGYQRLSSRSR